MVRLSLKTFLAAVLTDLEIVHCEYYAFVADVASPVDSHVAASGPHTPHWSHHHPQASAGTGDTR